MGKTTFSKEEATGWLLESVSTVIFKLIGWVMIELG